MNYIESREKLKDISDNDVVNYYHNPTPDVPMFLSLSELQRRKRVRDSYQANKPEEKSVAEELVEESQPQMAGVAGLPEAQPMMQAMAPQPEMPMEQMAQGGLAELDTGDMFDEQSYAGGGIVAFAKGGTPDQYGVTMPIVPTMDDLIMQTQESQRAFGVDPDFYKKILDESEKERIKDLSEAKKMDQAQLLLAMGSAFAGTPFFGQALAKAGERAVPIIGSMNRNQREINNMYRMADRKALEAQNAQNRGDAQAAQKAIVDRENLLLSAQLEEAKLKSAEGVAATRANALISGKSIDANLKVLARANDAFTTAYPSGAASGVFRSDPGFYQFVYNNYIKNAQNYADTRTLPPVPTESQLLDMYNNYKKKKGESTAAVKNTSMLSGEDSPLAQTRPSMPLLDKYPTRGSRSRNTEEELMLTNPIYDNIGAEYVE